MSGMFGFPKFKLMLSPLIRCLDLLSRVSDPDPESVRVLTSRVLHPRTPSDNKPLAVAGTRPTAEPIPLIELKHVVAFIREKVEPGDETFRKRGLPRLAFCIVNKNHFIS
jgi:hypothetical protein